MPAKDSNKKNAMEIVGPAEQARAMSALSRSTVLAGLTPWEQHKLAWQVKKQRTQLIRKLGEVEMQTVITEAVQLAEQRVDIAQEQALLAVHEEQNACLVAAGRMRDDAIVEAMELTAGSRELVADAIDQLSAAYISRMTRRARGGGCA